MKNSDAIKTPTSDEVEAQLQRILNSEEFERSTRMPNFLRYVVEQALQGNAKNIKGYTIGIEAFDKEEDFNPDTDATVRVEAIRLRKMLTLYYHGVGKDDPVIIKIPKGSYVPKFYYAGTLTIPKIPTPKPEIIKKAIPLRLMFIALFALLILGGIAFLFTGQYHHLTPHHGTLEQSHTVKPVIAVLPFKHIGGEDVKSLSEDMAYELIVTLSYFTAYRSLNIKEVEGYVDRQGGSSEIGSELDADYVIEGKVQNIKNNEVKLTVRLLNVKESTYSWSYSKIHNVPMENRLIYINQIMGSIASQLASAYGAIQTIEQERVKRLKGEAARNYACQLSFFVYTNNKSTQRHKEVTECLEDIVAHDASLSTTWAYLSWMYGDEARYGYNKQTDHKNSPQSRSLEAAQNAVDTDPNNPVAHQYMAVAALFNKNYDLAKYHTKLSLTLNPYDSEVLANAAWNYGQLGEWELAKKYAIEAINNNAGHPRWYGGILFAYYYKLGDYESALSYAFDSYQPEVLSSYLALAATYAQMGLNKEASKQVVLIQEAFPNYKETIADIFGSWEFPPEFKQKFLEGIQKSGLDISQ